MARQKKGHERATAAAHASSEPEAEQSVAEETNEPAVLEIGKDGLVSVTLEKDFEKWPAGKAVKVDPVRAAALHKGGYLGKATKDAAVKEALAEIAEASVPAEEDTHE